MPEKYSDREIKCMKRFRKSHAATTSRIPGTESSAWTLQKACFCWSIATTFLVIKRVSFCLLKGFESLDGWRVHVGWVWDCMGPQMESEVDHLAHCVLRTAQGLARCMGPSLWRSCHRCIGERRFFGELASRSSRLGV